MAILYLIFVVSGLGLIETGSPQHHLNSFSSGEVVGGRRTAGGKEEISYFETIEPLLYDLHGQLLLTTFTMHGHEPNIQLKFRAFSQQFVVDLTMNMNLLGAKYCEKVQQLGYPMLFLSNNVTQRNCYYHGHLNNDLTSSAAISTCYGIRGQISTDAEVYFIEPIDWLHSTTRHKVYRQSDFILDNFTCGHKDHKIDKSLSWTAGRMNNRVKRSNSDPKRPNITGPHIDKLRTLELYVVNDLAQFNAFKTENEVFHRTKDIVNIVSSIYQPLGIYVVLVGVEIWTQRNEIEISGVADDTMHNFIKYREKFINPKHHNDNAQLIIGEVLEEGVVGKAPIMTICTHKNSGGVNADRSRSIGPIATTIAHELGHNFGMGHDDEHCGCPDNKCVMSASGSGQISPTKWSDCSKQQMADTFHQGMDYCLLDIPDKMYGGDNCGNGYTEPGEECDCGLAKDCNNRCCNAATCRFTANATCASGWCCDIETCQPKPLATECRPAAGPCDLAEYCNGKSEHCPSEAYVIDGRSCEQNGEDSYCYKGRCNTLDAQCKLLWGKTGEVASALCFQQLNVMGSGYGHCGFNWVNESYQKCLSQDVMCGMLHCKHTSEKLMFWKEALAHILPDSYITVNRHREDCKAAILDVGLDMPDPGMAFDGAKCGDNKMCVSHRCVTTDSLDVPSCAGCNARGICNNLGQCHCDAGFAPPTCETMGLGGSQHSGPSTDGTLGVGFIVGLCLLFLVLLPSIVIFTIVTYDRRQRVARFIRRNWSRRCINYCPASSPANHLNDVQISTQDNNTRSEQSSLAARQAVNFSRGQIFFSRDISRPSLQSSTNNTVTEIPPIHKLSRSTTSVVSPRNITPTVNSKFHSRPNGRSQTNADKSTRPLLPVVLRVDQSSAQTGIQSTSHVVKSTVGVSIVPARPAPPPPHLVSPVKKPDLKSSSVFTSTTQAGSDVNTQSSHSHAAGSSLPTTHAQPVNIALKPIGNVHTLQETNKVVGTNVVVAKVIPPKGVQSKERHESSAAAALRNYPTTKIAKSTHTFYTVAKPEMSNISKPENTSQSTNATILCRVPSQKPPVPPKPNQKEN